MKMLHALNLIFTVMVLTIGIIIYSDYQEYRPNVTSKEDVANISKEINRYKDIKQGKTRYINHVNKNFKNHRVVDSIIEYVIYLFAGMVVFLVLIVIAISRMELRR